MSIEDATFFVVELDQTTLNGLCQWVTDLDSAWTCSLASPNSTKVTGTYDTHQGFSEKLNTIAADFGACAEVDETEDAVEFRPSGSCI